MSSTVLTIWASVNTRSRPLTLAHGLFLDPETMEGRQQQQQQVRSKSRFWLLIRYSTEELAS